MRKPRFWLTKTWNWQTKIEGCVKQTKLGNWRAQKKMLSRVEKNGSSKQKGISWSAGVSGIDFSHQHVRSFKALSRWKPKKVPEKYTRMARDDNQLSTPSVLGFIDVHMHYLSIYMYIYIYSSVYSYIRTYIGSMSDLRGWPLSQKMFLFRTSISGSFSGTCLMAERIAFPSSYLGGPWSLWIG